MCPWGLYTNQLPGSVHAAKMTTQWRVAIVTLSRKQLFLPIFKLFIARHHLSTVRLCLFLGQTIATTVTIIT